MRQMRRWLIQVTIVLVLLTTAAPALAHRPYFEENDIKADKPWQVDDPTISTALYATLDSQEDVDYFAFSGRTGQSILLSIVIPQIAGQEDFAPAMALFGPGLPAGDVPGRVARADGTGVLRVEPPGEATTFYEPFSRTSYWNRQERRVTLPADGRYTVAVWHDGGRAGRYVFVIGDKELPGGDLGFALKMKSYWTLVAQPAPAPTRPVCGDWMK